MVPMARAELTTCDSYAKAFQAHNIISLNSSDDERPPQDEVIRKSLQRQQHGLKGNGRKRKAPSSDSPDVIQLSASSSDAGKASHGEGSDSDMSFGSDAQDGAASPQQQSLRGPGSPRTVVFSAGAGGRKQRSGHPKGVIVVEEGALPERNSEVKRLLRGSRYFDDDLGEIGSGPRCYRCGQRGHLAAACSNEPKQVPCPLCAQFGHNKANCPSLLCYRCNRPGHIARECPNAAAAKGHVCLRCGRWDCASAGSGDYLRAEGNCTNEYDPEDLQYVRCYVCNQWGHVCCKGAPTEAPVLSCHNCGEQGHLAEECWMTRPTQVGMERQADYSRGSGSRYTPPQPYDRYQSGSYNSHHTGSGGRYADRVQAFANGTRAGAFDRQPYSRGWGRENYNAVPYDYQEPAGGRYRRY